MPEAVSKAIKPIFKDLSHLKLLRRCLGGKTQHPNESLNSLIWKYSPKTIGSSITITRIAAFLAVCDYNDGHKSQMDIMNAMGLTYNKNNVITAKDVDKKCLSTAFKRITAASLESRNHKRLKLAKENMKFKLSEECTYDPGAY
ncbi:uncharacterized protein TNCV_3414031 [Trichonephila clavipes]|uniref:Uncharacterized protein n=1 Tax=Trichonephila clavipes TaxID=2585209 RepID=A0A8X6RM27_TRICX|nr:uncharacterized protein TNCV_3414031 [Trichonephila clavipes]